MTGAWNHRQVNAAGMQFHVVEAGPADGKPVLLLHGFPETWWAWRHQLPALAAAGYRVYALDLRGFGDSDKQPQNYELVNLTRDVAGVMRALALQEVVVVGHAVGGAIAWLTPLASRRVAAVVAVCAPHPLGARAWRGVTVRGLGRYLRFKMPLLPQRRLRDGRLVRHVLTQWSAPASRAAVLEAADKYCAAMAQPRAAEAALEHLRVSTLRRSTRAELATPIQVPVLSLRAEADPLAGHRQYALDPQFAPGGVQVVSVPQAGHFLPEEAPGAVNEALVAFLRQVHRP